MSFAFLTTWWRRRRVRPLGHLRVRMYTRAGCHLCADAWQLLDTHRQRYGFPLEAIDIDGDPELVRRFGEQVPVIEVDGKVRFWGRINPMLLERLLHAEANSRSARR